MAVQPGIYNIKLQRRADYSVRLQFKDSTGTAINLTGWTVASQAWSIDRSTKYADFAITYTNRSTGTVDISLTNNQTATFPDELRYDVLLTDTNNIREYYLEGTIFVEQGYTT